MSEIADALTSLRPGAEWILNGNNYADLEWLDQVQTKPTEQEIIDEMAALDDAASVEETRMASVKGDAGFQDLLDKLKTMTPAEWQTYLDNNLTNIASAKVVIYRMGLALMLLARGL